jgi:hypothetical protein
MDQYGGAQKPFQRQAVTLISMVRQRGETPTQFAMRMEEGARQLKIIVTKIVRIPRTPYS